jgi:hypothetical protein
VPVTTHIGIFRTRHFWGPHSNPVCGLAIDLHAFSASMSRRHYPEAIYMFTRPVGLMARLLQAKLEPINAITVGSMDRLSYKASYDEQPAGSVHSRSRKRCVPETPFELDDTDAASDRRVWSVARGDAHPERFNEPEWIGAHKYLKRSGTGLSAVVKLAALAGLWDSAPDATRR